MNDDQERTGRHASTPGGTCAWDRVELTLPDGRTVSLGGEDRVPSGLDGRLPLHFFLPDRARALAVSDSLDVRLSARPGGATPVTKRLVKAQGPQGMSYGSVVTGLADADALGLAHVLGLDALTVLAKDGLYSVEPAAIATNAAWLADPETYEYFAAFIAHNRPGLHGGGLGRSQMPDDAGVAHRLATLLKRPSLDCLSSPTVLARAWPERITRLLDLAAFQRTGDVNADLADDVNAAVACALHEAGESAEAFDAGAASLGPMVQDLAFAIWVLLLELNPSDPQSGQAPCAVDEAIHQVAGRTMLRWYAWHLQQLGASCAGHLRPPVDRPVEAVDAAPPDLNDLVYGSCEIGLLFAPRPLAHEIRAARAALSRARTCGDARRQLPPHVFASMCDWFLGEVPADNEPLPHADLEGWPSIHYSSLADWLPQDVVERFGDAYSTMVDTGVNFPHEALSDVLEVLEQRGVRCTEDPDLDELFNFEP